MPLPLTEVNVGVTIVLIAYNNQDRLKVRLERDIIPTIVAHANWKFQIIIVDNSDEDKRPSFDVLYEYKLDHIFLRPGKNILYGPAMNLALGVCTYPFIVYVCSNHGHMYDPTWIDDLVNPIINDPEVAMTGSFYPSCSPGEMGFPPHLPHIHIQGGVFGAWTAALIDHPYTNDERWVHWRSDLYQCFQLLHAGFKLHEVHTVKSVWRECVNSPENWKFVHDNSEE